MFIIYTIDDKILLKPEELNKKFNGLEISYEDILLIKLKEKYLGKVLLNNGIVVSIKKFFMKSNLIVEIEGVINVEYEMDLIVFKPQVGDLLYGKIINSDMNYITVDCDIIKVKVPVEQLMKPTSIDDNERIWFWNYDDFKLYYDIGEEVRLKVLQVSFKSSQEISKIILQATPNVDNLNPNVLEQEEVKKEKITNDMIMEILCTFNQEGLGPLKWWNSEK